MAKTALTPRRGDGPPCLLLVMPPFGPLGLHRVFGHSMPPMALLVLAALARRAGWEVCIADLNEGHLPDGRPDAVAITVWTMLAPAAYRIADRYRALGVPVVLGGVHASLLPTEALRHADAVVVGEAEGILDRVLDDLLAGRSAGIYSRARQSMTQAPRAAEWLDLVEAWPSFRYRPMNTLQTTRGCRFNCSFCSVIRINGRGARHGDAAAVADDLAEVVARGQRVGPFRYTFLLDDDLAADRDYTARLCEAILAAGVRTTWGAQASIGLAGDDELLALAARAGCRVVFTGLESISRDALVECNKKNRPAQYGEAVGRLHRHGLLVEAGFIFGFDHDGPSVFDETAQLADRIGVDAAHFSILTPYPGTATFAGLGAEGRILHYDWARYDLYHAVIRPAQMEPAELEAGLWRAYRRFYARPARTRRIARHLAGRTHPAFIAAFAKNNHDYARRYRPRPPGAGELPAYVPDPADLKELLITSAAPASDALAVAVSLAAGPRPERRGLELD